MTAPIPVNFGCLPPLPDGYSVQWHPNLEMYMGHGPDDWESAICWNRFWVRDWCFGHAARHTPTTEETP